MTALGALEKIKETKTKGISKEIKAIEKALKELEIIKRHILLVEANGHKYIVASNLRLSDEECEELYE